MKKEITGISRSISVLPHRNEYQIITTFGYRWICDICIADFATRRQSSSHRPCEWKSGPATFRRQPSLEGLAMQLLGDGCVFRFARARILGWGLAFWLAAGLVLGDGALAGGSVSRDQLQAAMDSVPEGSGERTLSPYFFVFSNDPKVDQLPLESTSVSVDIAGVVAHVSIRQRYHNLGRSTIEAVYIFPVSTRAAVLIMTFISYIFIQTFYFW